MTRPPTPREVVIVVYPDVQSLDVTGPLEVFSAADLLLDARLPAGSPSAPPGELGGDRCGGDPRLPHHRGQPRRRPGGDLQRADDRAPHRHSITRPRGSTRCSWLVVRGRSARAPTPRCSIGSPLARRPRGGSPRCAPGPSCSPRRGCSTGVVRRRTGRRPRSSRDRHPLVRVDPEPIFVRDGAVWTSAGVTAGMDLALALVEEDLDREAALTIARHLVLFLRRPGNQSQFSATLAARAPERARPAGGAALRGGEPRGRPHGRGARAARPHEPAPLRAQLPRRGRDHARALRGAPASGGRPTAAGGEREPIARSPRGCGFGTAGDDAPGRFCARSESVPPSTAAVSITTTVAPDVAA